MMEQYLADDGATQPAVGSPFELRNAVLFVPRRAQQASDMLAAGFVGLWGRL